MTKHKRPRGANVAELEGAVREMADLLDQLIANQSRLEADTFDTKARLHFCMERIVVKKRRAPGSLIIGEQETRELSLAQLWQEDGPAYVEQIKAQIHALETLVAKAEAGEDAIRRAVADELRDRGSQGPQSTTGGEDDGAIGRAAGPSL